MRAVVYSHHRGEIRMDVVPQPPAPADGQLLVRVDAVGLNPVDYKTAGGAHALLFKFQWPRVIGFDFSGTVVAVGGEAGRKPTFLPGTHVFGMIRGLPQLDKGTLAEWVLVDAEVCARCPPGFTHAECASLPLCAITAIKQLRSCGLSEVLSDREANAISQGPRVLITCGAGGVGTAAIQLAKGMFGAKEVVVTASAPKSPLCISLGADRVVEYRGADGKPRKWWLDLADEISEGSAQPFDAILVGTDDETWDLARARLLAHGGGLASIMPPPTAEGLRLWMEDSKPPRGTVTFGIQTFLQSKLGAWILNFVTGSRSLNGAIRNACGGRYTFVVGAPTSEVITCVADQMAAGKLRAVVERVYCFEESLDAIARLRSGRVAGKVVVQVRQMDRKITGNNDGT